MHFRIAHLPADDRRRASDPPIECFDVLAKPSRLLANGSLASRSPSSLKSIEEFGAMRPLASYGTRSAWASAGRESSSSLAVRTAARRPGRTRLGERFIALAAAHTTMTSRADVSFGASIVIPDAAASRSESAR